MILAGGIHTVQELRQIKGFGDKKKLRGWNRLSNINDCQKSYQSDDIIISILSAISAVHELVGRVLPQKKSPCNTLLEQHIADRFDYCGAS